MEDDAALGNEEIARRLDLWAEVLEAEGSDRFRVQAYRRAATLIASMEQPIAGLDEHRLQTLKGIGPRIAQRVRAIVEGAELEPRPVPVPPPAEKLPVRGDLHAHSTASDGRATVLEMALAARAHGHEYLAITDHSQTTRIAGGLNETDMARHLERVRRVDDDVEGIRLLAGAEVDIRKDGTLDYPDALLADMDVVVCSVHFRHGLTGAQQTERILTAMSNEHADVLAHPTAKRTRRPPMDLDLRRIGEAAAAQGWAIEMNGAPDRLDLDAADARVVLEAGAKVVLDSDAHTTRELRNVRHAARQAELAGAEEKDIVNTWPLERLPF